MLNLRLPAILSSGDKMKSFVLPAPKGAGFCEDFFRISCLRHAPEGACFQENSK
jgi:hypothetical protein